MSRESRGVFKKEQSLFNEDRKRGLPSKKHNINDTTKRTFQSLKTSIDALYEFYGLLGRHKFDD